MDRTKSVKEIFTAEEISLIDLIHLFTDRLRYLYIAVAIFFVMGVLIAFTSPVEYKDEAKILSENGGVGNNSSLDALSGLAGLVGYLYLPAKAKPLV